MSGDGTTVSLAPYLDNTDVLASLSCSPNQIPKWNGSAWACAADVDTDTVLNEAQVDAYIANNGYLTSEVDGSTSNELQDLTFSSNTLGLTSSGVSFSLAAYLDNTDAQDMTLVGNTLALTGDGTSVSLASYLDNTDSQSIALNSNIISISGNASTIDLSAYLDDTDTDTQDLSLATNTLTLVAGGSVSLASYLDNTDSQDLSLATNTLSLSGDGTTVDLSAYLDNTDNQNLFLTINTDNGTDPVADGASDTLNFISGSGVTITGDSTTDTLTVASVLGASIDSSSEIVDGTIANIDLVNSAITISAGAGLTTGGSVSLGGSVTVDIGAGNGITVNANDIAVDLTVATDALSATTLSGSGLEALGTGLTLIQGCGDGQLLKWNETTDVWGCGNDIDTDTDAQDLTLVTNTLSLTNDGTSVSLAAYLDNTDSQNLFLTYNADNGSDPVADGTTDTLNFVSGTGVTITGDSTTDTLTIASVLGATIDSSSEIVDGTVANIDLVNSGVTVVAGSGLITGGAISLGGTVTLNIGAGTAITINGDDVAITADGINYTEIADNISLDATTTTSLGANDLVTNASSTGDIIFQDNGSSFLTLSDTGSYDYTLDATDNPAYTITNAGSSNVNTNLSGTGDFTIQDNGTTVLTVLDNGTFQFRNSADNASSFLVENSSGLDMFEIDTVGNAVRIGEIVDDTADVLLVLDGVSGAADPTGIAGGIYYNTTSNKFRCYQNSVWQNCVASNSVGLVSALVANTAAISNTETQVIAYTIPANTTTAGDTYRIRAYATRAGANATAPTIRVRVGTTTLTGNIAATLTGLGNASTATRVYEGLVTIRTVGAAGTVGGGLLESTSALGNLDSSTATVALDTTANKIIELTLISGNATNSYTFTYATIEKMSNLQ